MAKVVSSAGLQEFIATGKPTQVFDGDQTSKAQRAKVDLNTKLAVVDNPNPDEAKPNGAVTSPKEPDKPAEAVKPEEDTGLEAEDHDLAERAKKRIGKKHYEMKKAQEDAAKARSDADEADRFAETLFNEREQWRRRAEEAEGKGSQPADTKPKEPELTKPDINDPKYKDGSGQFLWQQYTDDVAEYSGKKAVADDRTKQEQDQLQKARAAEAAAIKARIDKAVQKYSDWHDVVGKSEARFRGGVGMENPSLRFLAKSEYGTDIAYFLAKNPKDAARIGELDPDLAVAELGKLQTQFEKPADPPAQAASKTVEPQSKTASAAPAPITPISTSGTGSIVVDPAKMDFKQLRAWHRERRKNGTEK